MENTSEKLDETVMKMKKIAIANITTVVPVMNGHPRDQAKVSVHIVGGRSSEGRMGTLK